MLYALVIVDPVKALAARRKMYADAFKRQQPNASQQAADLFAQLQEPTVPAIGEVWTVAESVCPDALPNCRNCGDPAHADTCRAAGHCSRCGTLHGIAPDAVLIAHGLELQALPKE